VLLNWFVSWLPGTAFTPQVGDVIRIRRRWGRSPLAGSYGRVVRVTEQDPYGPILVEFPNGLCFRYRADEVVASPERSASLVTASCGHQTDGTLQELPLNRVEDVGGLDSALVAGSIMEPKN
jgi:hypothetical protein